MSRVLSHESLRRLVDTWLGQGTRVIGPARLDRPVDRGGRASERAWYTSLRRAEQLLLGGFVRPANSIKEFLFPRHEPLYRYRFVGKQVELSEVELPATEQIIVAARPCDAAAAPILDHVFHWGSEDPSYRRRRDLTTIVTLACSAHDGNCFCTSMDLGPDSTQGSDAMLLDLGDGTLEVRCLSDKGLRRFDGATEPSDRTAQVGPGPEVRVDRQAVGRFLADGYEQPAWSTWTARCLSCGACAYTCPTCHCFDIVDESAATHGARVRNWDACQFALFTLHASGHNPRSLQGQRQRQRIYHKFRIYPEKFGPTLCTGCGNCTRNCPVHLGVRPVLEEIERFEAATLSRRKE